MRILAAVAILFSVAVPSFAYRQSAWIPPWNAAALTSMQSNVGALSESNPVWYSWNPDGTLFKNWNAENDTWRAAMTGTLLMPTVQNVVNGSFNGNVAATVLATDTSRETAASEIAQLVTMKSYDGIDIDYERLPTTSRDNFTKFLTTLAQKLHVAGKKLSVSVYPKKSDSDNWNGPGAEDWAAIGQLADSVKIMAYDYSYSGTAPGPIAPLDWMDKVATYAQSAIPSSRIVMALPWYGYDWSAAGTKNVSYAEAMQLAANNGANISHDVNGEATFTYNGHTVFFQDAASYRKKVEMLETRHASIGGFAAWSAGVEDPQIWNVIRDMAGLQATPPASQPASMSISGPASLMTTPGGSVSANYNLVAVNGFSGTATVTIRVPSDFKGSVTSDSATVAAGGTVRVTVNTTAATPLGSHPFQISLTSGALTTEQTVTLMVSVPARRRAVR